MDRGAFSQGLREGAHHLDAMSVPGGGGSCSETEVPTVAEPTTPTELDETEPDDDYESGVESCRQPSRIVACAIAPV